MFDYYIQLRRDTGLPVLPIALFLRVGLDGIGWDAYEEHFWEQRIVRFEYTYVGLPALDGVQYATGENLLGRIRPALQRQSFPVGKMMSATPTLFRANGFGSPRNAWAW